jgi:hypothetical protein
LSPRSWVRLALTSLPLLGLTAATLPVAYAAMFSLFQPYDDEGYLLLSLKGHLEGHALYDEVFSQYGPFYYMFNGTLFRAVGLDVTHDAGRMVTLSLWILATLAGAVAIFFLTRSILLAVSGQVLFIGALSTVVNEPMHPGALLGLLLVIMVLVIVTLAPRRPTIAVALLGGLAAAASLVKINVGVFALISLGAAVVLSTRLRSGSLPLKASAAVAMAGIPFAVMARDLDARWALSYAVLVGLAAVALVVVASRSTPDRMEGVRTLAWLVVGAAGIVGLLSAVTLAMGTSLSAIVDGALLRPLRQPESFTLPFPMPWWAPLGGTAGLAAAVVASWLSGQPRSNRNMATMATLAAVARITAGILIWTSVATVGRVPGSPLSLGLPLAWVAALPPKKGAAAIPTFARVALASLAVLQALHAYPVAGSQMAWSGMLLIPVGAICLGDGLAVLVSRADTARRRLALHGLGSIPIVAFLAWLVISSVVPYTEGAFHAYDQGVRPQLPGVSRLRISETQARTFEDLTTMLRSRCSTFVSVPGLNSLYLFSDLEPPTYLNATAWMYLFDHSTQERVVQRSQVIEDLCTVRSTPILSFWAQGRPVPAGPLVDFVFRDLRRFGRAGDYRVFTDEERQR